MKRFILRHLEETDALALSVTLNNKKLIQNLREGIPFPYMPTHAKAFIADCRKKGDYNQLVRAISIGGELVGCISVARRDLLYRRAGELGYYLREDCWGQGITTDAAKQICALAFNRFDIVRIYAEIYVHNTASMRVLEKVGFKHEGTLRQSLYMGGEIYDSRLYSLLRGEINPGSK